MRTKIARKTKETQIDLALDLSGGAAKIDVPIPFLQHMLGSFANHAKVGLTLKAKSLDKDEHHLAEDVAITLGRALRQIVETTPIKRFGHEIIPMDDALVGCYVDLGGRGYYEGPLPDPLYEHVLRSFSHDAGLNCHVVVFRGRDPHHIIEAAFKALARALRQAWQKAESVESTKGDVTFRGG